jgi:hypothetical protein
VPRVLSVELQSTSTTKETRDLAVWVFGLAFLPGDQSFQTVWKGRSA